MLKITNTTDAMLRIDLKIERQTRRTSWEEIEIGSFVAEGPHADLVTTRGPAATIQVPAHAEMGIQWIPRTEEGLTLTPPVVVVRMATGRFRVRGSLVVGKERQFLYSNVIEIRD